MPRNHFSKYLLSVSIIVSICIVSSLQSEAGILSGLAKLGKAAKKVDVDVPTALRKIELPDAYKNLNTTDLMPNASGSWDIRLADGKIASLDTLIATGDDLSQHALMIRSIDVPDELAYFDNIPNELPVFVSTRKNQVFELSRGKSIGLKHKALNIPLSEGMSVKTAIYNFERPLMNSQARFIDFSDKLTTAMPQKYYGSKTVVENVSPANFMGDLALIKNQNIVLAGKITDDALLLGKNGKSSVSINELKALAASNDLNLVILETANPNALLKQLSKTQQFDLSNPSVLSNTTGDFFNALSGGKSALPLEVSMNATGRSQVAMHMKSDRGNLLKTVTDSNGDSTQTLRAGTIIRLLTHSVRVFRPDGERSNELYLQKREAERSGPLYYTILALIYLFIFYIIFRVLRFFKRLFTGK